ncbi:hypothetical protein Hanom_Chr07g00631441 [Helianthus anomalus]
MSFQGKLTVDQICSFHDFMIILLHKLNEFSYYSLLQEPFKSLPLIWTVHEKTLATHYKNYVSDGQF